MIIFIVLSGFVSSVYSENPMQTNLELSKKELQNKQNKEPSASIKKPSTYNKAPRFNPSEKIKADSSVPFPVDI